MPLSHFLATCKVVLSCGLGRDQPPFAGFRLVDPVSFWCFVLALQPDLLGPPPKNRGQTLLGEGRLFSTDIIPNNDTSEILVGSESDEQRSAGELSTRFRCENGI